jgi:N-methylhydantoinase B/oxoprolinase/acetone carboxylase alpha subunit
MDTRQPAELATRVDPVALQIIKGALRSAQLAMEKLLQRTAMSPVIREKRSSSLRVAQASPFPLAGEGRGCRAHDLTADFSVRPRWTTRPFPPAPRP